MVRRFFQRHEKTKSTSKISTREYLWLFGIPLGMIVLLSFITIIFQIGEAKLSKTLEGTIVVKMVLPLITTFVTVSITAAFYRKMLKDRDEKELNEQIIESVEKAIYGGYYSDSDRKGNERLNSAQRFAKNKLKSIISDDFNDRLWQLNLKNNVKIHDFNKTWDVLINSTFSHDEILRDFSIASNAVHEFQAYRFEEYYKSLIKVKKTNLYKHIGETRVMIYCDNASWQYGEDHDMTDIASKRLENSIKLILNEYRDNNKAESPAATLKRLGKQTGSQHIQIRLINSSHLELLTSDEKQDVYRPFNIYGSIAISRSIVTRLQSETTEDIPYIQVSFDNSVISTQQRIFDHLWNVSSNNIDEFADKITSLEDLGQGKLLAVWSKMLC